MRKDMSAVEKKVRSLVRLANVMDSQFKIPGTSIRAGLDAVIGIIPGIGDTAGLVVSSWIVFQSARLGARKRVLLSMAFNVFMDWLIGLIPLIGDIFDIGWKGNLGNVSLVRREFPHENGSSENGIQANDSDRAPMV